MHKSAPLPYADVAPALLSVIYDSLGAIYECRFGVLSGDTLFSRLREITSRLSNQSWAKTSSVRVRNNPHILEHINVTATAEGFDSLPRVSRLCLEACAHAESTITPERFEEARRTMFVPSPLSILVDVLTVPSRPESSAYGFAIARALLFSRYKVHPPSASLHSDWTTLSISEVQDTVESFRTYFLHRDNIHYSSSNPARAVVAHFLALTGVFRLRFGTAGRAPIRKEHVRESCLQFFRAKDFLHPKTSDHSAEQYEFRLSASFDDIPEAQEIINALTGIPVPISGASTVFFGGLQKAHDDSLVMSVSGAPGTGKTSFVLALAAALAPFGTRCLYCTFEEDAETLRRRVVGLTPQYFRRSTLPNVNATEWFFPYNLNASEITSVDSFADRYLKVLARHLGSETRRTEDPLELPAIAPLLVVVDSVTTLYKDESSDVEAFCRLVRYLRDLNCLVVLLSAEDIPEGSRLEYLVDTVIALRYEGTDSADKKPTRLFQLLKTRLQLSRPGAHVLHLSGERGVRISPQLPSQLDARKIHKAPFADRDRVIDTLRVDGAAARSYSEPRLVDLYRRSRILVHGHGSSGKAPLGLKLLIAPLLPVSAYLDDDQLVQGKPRVLVISFLYPQSYYHENVIRIGKFLRRTCSHYVPPEVSALVLTPGFIGPEDFIALVLDRMDKGLLDGTPITGVLLDGLHNAFLQFPSLQRSDMVWPTLYNLLGRYEVTVVTTFTTFSNVHSPGALDLGDADIVLKGQLPFLHALVQATDFYLQVEPREPTVHDRHYHLTVRSAFGQRVPNHALVWNADTFAFESVETIAPEQMSLTLSENALEGL